jgi:hypothetical protein
VEPIVEVVVGRRGAGVDPANDRCPIAGDNIDRRGPSGVDGSIIEVNIVLLCGRVGEERRGQSRKGRGRRWVDAETASIRSQEVPDAIASSRCNARAVTPRIGEDRGSLGNAAIMQLQTGGLCGSRASRLAGVESRGSNHTTDKSSDRESDVELHSSINKRE